MNKNNKQENFSDIALILGSLTFGILLTIMPLNLEKIFPLIIINNILGFLLLAFSLLGILGSDEIREHNIGDFLNNSIILLFQLSPFIIIIIISYIFENNWLVLIIKYTLLIISFFTVLFILNKFVVGFKNLSFNGKREILESTVKIITCIVGLGTLLFQIIKFLSSGY